MRCLYLRVNSKCRSSILRQVCGESIVSSPSMFHLHQVNSGISFAHNGMLYWMSHSGNFLIGLDLFMMDNRNSNSISSTSSTMDDGDDSDHYECLFIEIDGSDDIILRCVGVYKGCLQKGDYDYDTHAVFVWELNEEVHRGAGKSCLELRKRVYSRDWEMVPDDIYDLNILSFDPNNDGTEGILYMFVSGDDDTCGDIFMYNICRGKFLKIFENHARVYEYFPVAVPQWPTPVPRLPEREANALIPSSP